MHIDFFPKEAYNSIAVLFFLDIKHRSDYLKEKFLKHNDLLYK